MRGLDDTFLVFFLFSRVFSCFSRVRSGGPTHHLEEKWPEWSLFRLLVTFGHFLLKVTSGAA